MTRITRLIFHEASHTDEMEEALRTNLSEAFEAHWRPFLESRSSDPDDRRQALVALTTALALAR